MESVSRLREILVRILAGGQDAQGEQDLFDELMVQKSRLVNLLNFGRRNQQEQREVESGRIVIDGKQVAVNSDFARQVIFLSQQLDCSERYVAGILHNVMAENPNIAPVHCLEVTIAEFHQRRRHLVEVIRFLLEATEAASSPDSNITYERLSAFVRSELISGSSGGESLQQRIFNAVESMEEDIRNADAARKNAGSNTTAPSGPGNLSLGYDVLNSRYDSLKYERRTLAIALSSVSRMGYTSPSEVRSIVEWLSLNPNHSMTFYVLTTLLLSLDTADPQSAPARLRRALATDASLVGYMSTKLAASTEWKEPGLKATILLKWTLFLTEARHADSSLDHRSGFRTEELELQIWNAVQGDAFTYLALALFQLQRQQGGTTAASLIRSLAFTQEQYEHREVPTSDFHPFVLSAFENLVRSLITHASSELRKIKQRQEDLVHASARTDRTRSTSHRFTSNTIPESDKSGPLPRNDIAMLFCFIGLLYSALPPERALQFWGSGPSDPSHVSYLEYVETTAGRLPTFLQWAVWSTSIHDITMSTALYDMLGGLAKGQQCSELTYNFMARAGGEVIPGSSLPSSSSSGPSISWTVIFGLLDSWTSSSTNPRHQPQSQQPLFGLNIPFGNPAHSAHVPLQQPSQQPVIGAKEVLLAQSFLRLLSTVVTHSVAVRVAISGHVHFRAIPTLVSLIPLGVPLELKGALFDTLAAFCEPGASIPGVEICKAVWTLMERLEVINVRTMPTGTFASVLPSMKGVEAELEEIETVHRLYPATIPFLRLLSTLIHTPKRVPLKDRVADVPPISTIPETLGQPYRLPGIAPFTAFVVDNVFAKIPHREYSRPSDRWQLNNLCLCYIERALASFDLESLVATPQDPSLTSDFLVSLLIHPGYDIMNRLLTNSPLQSSVLSYIVDGVEGFEKDLADEEPFFRSTIVRVLRIVHRVLEIQDIFLDVLVPLISDVDSGPMVGTVHPRSYYTRFDRALSFNPQYIPALAAYIAFPSHPELVLLAVKIITVLSNSSSDLATLIERSHDSERILRGFMQILNVESMEDVLHSETLADQATGAGAPDFEEGRESLEQAIRIAALDLLIQGTDSSRRYPNIAHFLLFGGANNEHQIQDPHALGAQQTSIHVLLDLVNTGVPRLKGKDHHSPRTNPLFLSLPGLAERCYRVISQLCTHPRTSDFTTRYLRTRENFFARQLACLPAQTPLAIQEPSIQVLYNDGSRVTTTVPSLSSFLRLRSCIFDLVALDLHILTSKGHSKGVSELLGILFGNEPGYMHDDSSSLADDVFRPFREVGQSHMRVIEFLQSLMFDWSDSLVVPPIELQFLGQINLQLCMRKNATGCEIVDRAAVLSLLTAAKKSLHSQGAIATTAQAEQLQREVTYILESCAVENHRREVTHAISTGYEAWRRLLDMTLTKCFDRLPHDRRENMLFDLLHALPTAIRSIEIEEGTAVLLSEAVLSSITKLREDRRYQIVAHSAGGDRESGSLPAERLYSILQSILEGIIDNNRVELVRGNLYAALINYVYLIASPHIDSEMTTHKDGDFLSLSLTSSMVRGDSLFGGSQSLVPFSHSGRPHASSSSLETGSLAILKGVMERLVATVSRDAIDGTEVWKTVAFMLLDALVQLSGLEKQHGIMTSLTRHGILSNFVRGVKESDARLLSVLKPDPDDLNPLYVYEAKMSFFIRMTHTRAGAERLLEAQLIPILAQCDYLDARPEADQSFMDQDSFLPSAIQRYHQLFVPSLQLIDGMLATLGTKHTALANQALEFLSSHSATLVILLKNDADHVSLALLEEIHLIVTLCSSVLPSVPKSELLSAHSGFGALHSAILSLATRCLSSGRCFGHVIPQTDTEVQTTNVYAFGYGSETKFDMTVRQRERLLQKSIIVYVGVASDFTEPEITLVLSPITTVPRHDERGSHFLATIPTMGDALEALSVLHTDLSQILKQISDVSAELAARDHIGVDNIHEVVKDIHPSFLQDLDIVQKRALICQELENIKKEARRNARVLLDTVEMVLLLLLRHIQHYGSPSSSAPSSTLPTSSTLSSSHLGMSKSVNPTNAAMRFLAAPDPGSFKSDIGKRLGPILGKLAALELDDESLGPDWQASHAYIEIMSRRLRDSVGLHDQDRSDTDGRMD